MQDYFKSFNSKTARLVAAVAFTTTIITFIIETAVFILFMCTYKISSELIDSIFSIMGCTFIINSAIFITLTLISYHQKRNEIKLQKCIVAIIFNVPVCMIYIYIIFLTL